MENFVAVFASDIENLFEKLYFLKFWSGGCDAMLQNNNNNNNSL